MANLKYPFDILSGKDTVTRKEAKALIIKFLKREHCFKEMITECLWYHPHLHSIDEVLDNMTDASSLYECLFYSDRIFPWECATTIDRGNANKYWTKLRDKWWEQIDNPRRIKIIRDTINETKR
jgi:hypothetical protein